MIEHIEAITSTRREYLAALTTGTATLTGGCLGWFNDDQESDQEQDQESADDADGAEGNAEPEGNGGDERHAERNGSAENENTSRDDETRANGSNQSNQSESNETRTEDQNQERQREPTDNQTEINRDEFNGTDANATATEVEQRPADHVEVEVDRGGIERDGGMISISGTVTNVSDEGIDVVDIELVFLDADGREVGRELRTVRDLGAGETETWGIQTIETTLRGEPERVRPEATPMDYVET